MELIAQAMPTRTPPTRATIFGPKRSTSQPSTGTSQVSVNTKIVKATWIAGRPQGNFWSIGLTNSVQPYCRFAIITMQTMPTSRWSRRTDTDAVAAETLTDDIFVLLPQMVCISIVQLYHWLIHPKRDRTERSGIRLTIWTDRYQHNEFGLPVPSPAPLTSR